jgi:transcriptional regulator with XRE-family HTH domain
MAARRRVDVEFAREVIDRRKEAGLSQGALAGLMQARGWSNFHQQTLLKIEKGTRGVSLAEAVDLADCLGAELSSLLYAVKPTGEEARLLRVQRALWQVSMISSEALS